MRDAELRQMIGADFSLFKERCDQAISDTTMHHALAYGIDARVRHRLQRVGYMNATHTAAAAVQAGRFGQRVIGADTGGNDHQIGRNLDAVFQAHGADTAVC